MNASRAVTMDLAVRLVDPGPASDLSAVFRYAASDPYEVLVLFDCGMGLMMPWTFSRQLLRDGLAAVAAPEGGDVRIWPESGGRLLIEIESHDGRARFEMTRDAVAKFVGDADALVPEGTEDRHQVTDLDAELEALLKTEGGQR